MQAKIFSFIKPTPNSVVASTRIAMFLKQELGLPLCWDATVADAPLDLLIIVNGAFAFCKHLEPLGRAIYNAKVVLWVQNDYTIVPPKAESKAQSPFRAAFRERNQAGKLGLVWWSTVANNTKGPLDAYINWNQLTYEPREPNFSPRHVEKVLYYGAFRHKRVTAFNAFFNNPVVPMLVSSPSAGFAARYPKVHTTPPFDRASFYSELGQYGLGLYIEDKLSHTQFHSPANRFYEMLSARLPMVFQPEAVGGLLAAGFDVEPYVVHSSAGLKKALEHREHIQKDQWRDWCADYVGRLRNDVRIAYAALKKVVKKC